MLVKCEYEFVTGKVVIEVEVSEEQGAQIKVMEEEQKKVNRKETRRHELMSWKEANGEQFSGEENTEEQALAEMDLARLRAVLTGLLPQQKRLLRKVFFEERSIASIAREEGVNERSVRERLARAFVKIQRYPK